MRENNRYEKAKRRFMNCTGNKMASDKELIQFLEEEIEQYRNRIENQDRIIKGLEGLNTKRDIETERSIYHCGVDGGTGKDFTVTRWYEDGILIKEEIKPCQETDERDKSTCPPIEI